MYQQLRKAACSQTDSPSQAGSAAGVTLSPRSAACSSSRLKAASSPKLHSLFLCLSFPTPQLKPQQSIVKWTRYPAASNDVLQTVEPTDTCSSALGKELFAELWVRAGDGNCCSCCSEIHLYLQVRALCLEIHSASGKKLPTKWSFQLFRIHPLPGL